MSDKEPSEEAKQLQKILNDRVRTFDVREHGMIAYAAGELKIIDAALQQARREGAKEQAEKDALYLMQRAAIATTTGKSLVALVLKAEANNLRAEAERQDATR